MAEYGQKGVVLFIVEGASDKIALGLPLSKIICTDTVQFAIIHGDCLNRNGDRSLEAVKECVRSIMQRYNYKRSDFIQIVHVIDTDGSFIPDSAVLPRAEGGVEYFSDHIETGEPEETILRHHRRRASAQLLCETKHIMKIPYELYYMSRNLEHAMLGVADGVSSKRKVAFAESFAERYIYDQTAFMDLVFSDAVAVSGNYEQSWQYIMNKQNSLKRGCNLNIFLGKYYYKMAEQDVKSAK